MDYGNMERTEGTTVDGEADGGLVSDWPVVIRPQPLRLEDLEARIVGEMEFARAVVSRPAFARSLARAVLTRDPSARLFWRDSEGLAERLMRLAAGATASSIT